MLSGLFGNGVKLSLRRNSVRRAYNCLNDDFLNSLSIDGAVMVAPSAKLGSRLKTCPPPTNVFTGRADILLQLDEYFCPSPSSFDSGEQRVFVLYGLGGAGKSQIAFKFVKQCQVPQPSRYGTPLAQLCDIEIDMICSSSFWKVLLVDASTVGTITSDLEAIARAEGIGEAANDTLIWLSGHCEEWLLLLDNADDTEVNLRDFFPTCYHGNILITSRNPETCDHAPRSNCKVSDMEPHDAIDLLLTVARKEPTDEAQNLATPIVQELGYLALAIVQAGAYISKSCSLARYLQIYRKHRDELLEHYHVQKTDDYKWTAYTTWQISFEKLSSRAATFLQLCAFLHHKGISEGIFQNAAARIAIDQSDDPNKSMRLVVDFLSEFKTPEGSWNDSRFLDIINEVCSYSLINSDNENQVFSIHPLVHAWTRTTLKGSEETRACTMQILSLSITCQLEAEDYAFRRTLLPHIDEVCAKRNVNSDLAKSFAQVYLEGGRWKEAEELEVVVVEMMNRVFGKEHPDTLMSVADLAWTYREQGRWNEAEELEVMVMETTKRVLGKEHPDTLRSIANLAETFLEQGRWKEAEELVVLVMEIRKRVLGKEHLETLASVARLTQIYRQLGRWNEAEGLDMMVVETRKRVLGDKHPDTLQSIINLAHTIVNQGRWKESEGMQIMVVEMMKKVLGEEHPNTLLAIGNLASTYSMQGQWKEAEELGLMVVEMRKRVLGKEHPDTLVSITNLALTYSSQGWWKEAEDMEVMVMETQRRALGEEHPDTVRSIACLASTYGKQSRWKEAEQLQMVVVERAKKMFGEEHPNTLMSISSLASTYQNLGWLKEAEELQVMVVEAMKRVFGEEHPDTLKGISYLALTYQNQGRWKEAEELEVVVMETRIRVLGKEHPDTLTSIADLALTYCMQSQWKEAEELGVMVVEMRKKVLGKEHLDTLKSISNLVETYLRQGKWKDAEELGVIVTETQKRVS